MSVRLLAVALVLSCGGSEEQKEAQAELDGMFSAEEIAECRRSMDGALAGEGAEGLYIGGYVETRGTRDPTEGLLVAVLPLEDGPLYGQMLNTYVDCIGEMSTGGTYRGTRDNGVLQGSWTIRQLDSDFDGEWSAVAAEDDARVDGSYSVTGGQQTSMECNNPDGSQFGVDDCYCVSPGEISLHRADEAEVPTERNIPFAIERSEAGVRINSVDNPLTGPDESSDSQPYAVIDLDRVCSNEMPLIAFCPNAGNDDPMELAWSEPCAVELPVKPVDLLKALTCPCLWLAPLEEGHDYAVVGVNDEASQSGFAVKDLETMSFGTFRY